MNRSELKSCPFCGGVSKYVCEKGTSSVRCTNIGCRAIGPLVYVSDEYIARDYAIEKWNRRATNETN